MVSKYFPQWLHAGTLHSGFFRHYRVASRDITQWLRAGTQWLRAETLGSGFVQGHYTVASRDITQWLLGTLHSGF